MREAQIEAHLAKRVKELGGEVRKVQWVGRKNAPDRLVMLPRRSEKLAAAMAHFHLPTEWPHRSQTIWVELKNPETIKTFPANAHERAQHREHERMRAMGQRVEVIGTIEQVEELLK
jgi:hypothetical protein